MGFYREGVVYLSLDFADGASVELRQTALEEVAHFVTGATDSSRDFQDFAFKLATRLEMVAAGEIPSLGYTRPGSLKMWLAGNRRSDTHTPEPASM